MRLERTTRGPQKKPFRRPANPQHRRPIMDPLQGLALAIPLLLCLTLAPNAVQAASTQYLRGYAQAQLDAHFPKLDLTVSAVNASDEATLTARQCLPAEQRDKVQDFFAHQARIARIRWELPCNTRKPASPHASSQSAEEKHVEALPTTRIFRHLLADPRQVRFSGYYQYHENHGKNFSAGAATFGETFGLFRSHFHNHPYQIGIEAAVFSLFNLDTKSHNLVNADYLLGFPVTYRTGDFSYRARFYHISSHLGDEFILNNPKVKRINLSYETLDLLVSWSHNGIRLYGGGGAIVHSVTPLNTALVEFGGEYRYPDFFAGADLVAGADFKLSQTQGFGLNQSYIIGLAFHRNHHTVRTVLQYYTGFSPNGQFYTEQVRSFGFGLQFEL